MIPSICIVWTGLLKVLRPSACHVLIQHTPINLFTDIYQPHFKNGPCVKTFIDCVGPPACYAAFACHNAEGNIFHRENHSKSFSSERRKLEEKGFKIQHLCPRAFFLKSRKTLRTIVMLQISFYITTISRGIEIINLSYFHFIETLAYDEHCLAVTSCKIQ